MKKFIRVVALLLCLAVLSVGAVLLTGCGDSSSKKSSSKYGYVTNSDGTRTFYEKNNKHIQVVD